MLNEELIDLEYSRGESLEERKIESLTGEVWFNGHSKRINLSDIGSPQEMVDATKSKIGSKALTKLGIWNLSGSQETAKMLIEFLAERITEGQLTNLCFSRWKGSASEIQP